MNKVDSIFLQRYKRLTDFEIERHIVKFFEDNDEPLNKKQKQVLSRAARSGGYGYLHLPFQAYSWKKNVSETSNTWWRSTIPFFFIWWFIMALLMPFKWFWTGKWHYDAEDFGVPLLRKWYIKLFNE
jgi:hypothetical protein